MRQPHFGDIQELLNQQYDSSIINLVNLYLKDVSLFYSQINEVINETFQNKIASLKKQSLTYDFSSFSSLFFYYKNNNVFNTLLALSQTVDFLKQDIYNSNQFLQKINSFNYNDFRNYTDFSQEGTEEAGMHLGYPKQGNSFTLLKPTTITKFQDLADTPSISDLSSPSIFIAEESSTSIVQKKLIDLYKPDIVFTSFTLNGTYELSSFDCFNKVYLLDFGTCDKVYLKLSSAIEGGRVTFKCVQSSLEGNQLIFDTSLIGVNFDNVSHVPLGLDNSLSFVYYQDQVKGQYLLIEYFNQ